MGRAAPIVPFQVELDLPGAQGLAADVRGVTARFKTPGGGGTHTRSAPANAAAPVWVCVFPGA